MSLAKDLVGIGQDPGVAERLGSSNLTTLAGVGTAQVGARAIPNFTNNVLATTSAGQDAFVLPANAELEVPYMVVNSGPTTTAQIFPPTSGTINQLGANLPVTIVLNHGRIFIRKSSTRWISLTTA